MEMRKKRQPQAWVAFTLQIYQVVAVQTGASLLPGWDPLAASPEDKEWVPWPVPMGDENKGAKCLALPRE